MSSSRKNMLGKGILAAGVLAAPAIALLATDPSLEDSLPSLAIGLLGGWAVYTLLRMRHRVRFGDALARQNAIRKALDDHAMVVHSEDNKIVSVNETLLRNTGWKSEHLIGANIDVLYLRDDWMILEEVRKSVVDGVTWQGEVRMRRRDGTSLWTRMSCVPRYDRRGEVIGAISVRTDVTEMRQYSADRETFAALHEIPDEIYLMSVDDLKVQYMNRSALRRHGRLEGDCSDFESSAICDDSDIDWLTAMAVDCLATLGEAVQREVLIDGRPFEARTQLISPSAKEPRILVHLHDISERRKIEKLKDEFITTASHELRTPLTSIKGSMSLILSGSAGPISDKSRAMVEIAHRNADRLILIVNDILDLEKISAGKMRFRFGPADLRDIAGEAVQNNRGFAEGFGVQFRVTMPERPAVVRVDPDRVFQVLTNLLSNAAKFSPPGSEVHVEVAGNDETVRISVEDHGRGIPKEAQAKIFDRFAQADKSDREGAASTGLGLAIVKAILDRHGAQYSLDSEVGRGTKFTIEFDRIPGDVVPLKEKVV